MKIRKSNLTVLLLLVFLMLFQFRVSADDNWILDGDAFREGESIVLVPCSSSSSGSYIKTVPLDLRNGFSLSFEYCITTKYSGNREGFQIVLANRPIGVGSYADLGYWDYIGSDPDVCFYGIEFHSRSGHIGAVTNNGTNRSHIVTTEANLRDGNWHSVVINYRNRLLQVYQDGELMLTCDSFAPSDLSYIGFTAGTSYHWDFCTKQEIRNVSLKALDSKLIHLDANGGNCDETSIYALSNSTTTFPTPARTGYTFLGWYTHPNSGSRYTGNGDIYSNEQTAYAHWQANPYTVSLDANGGTCKKSAITVTYEDLYRSLPTPKKNGYNFDGWFMTKYGDSKITTASQVLTASDHTLYARWSIKTFILKLNPNKGKLAKSKRKVSVNYKNTVGTLPTPKRSGYTFLGWYTKKSGGTKIKSTRVIKANDTYYAHWVSNKKPVSFKLNANEGSLSQTSLATTYGGKLKGLPTPSRNGYSFLGWYTEKSGGTKVTSSMKASAIISTTKTLYAHWSKKSASSSTDSSSGGNDGNPNKPFVPDCVFCGGDGDCSRCGGDGYVYSFALDDNDRINCYKCSGTGNCSFCHGSGKRY